MPFIFSAALAAGAVLLSLNAAIAYQTDFKLTPAKPRQGQTLAVRVHLPDGLTPPVVHFNNKDYKLYLETKDKNGEQYRALIGVPADLKVGDHDLELGNEHFNLVVEPGAFPVQRIKLSKEKDNFLTSPGEEDTVDAAKKTASEKQLWSGRFVMPNKYRISTGFGLRRMVNGKLLKDYFHSGIDYAAPSGSPVVATQAGTVIFAHTGWRLHGNTIAIDHGQGVVSFYLHLSKILVNAGQKVESGQLIARSGSSGRATGPHLHFSIYVNGDATDPMDWFGHQI